MELQRNVTGQMHQIETAQQLHKDYPMVSKQTSIQRIINMKNQQLSILELGLLQTLYTGEKNKRQKCWNQKYSKKPTTFIRTPH